MKTARNMFYHLFGLFIVFIFSSNLYAQVVINELHYNPPDDGLEDGGQREFVELYNSGGTPVDLSGYQFNDGIQFTFPTNLLIQPNSFLVIAANTSKRYWSNVPFRLVGPYEGRLRNSGERITLVDTNGDVVDTLKYEDSAPWSQTADGYGSSLERIDASLPSEDFHSWRSSLTDEGTPGRQNSVVGIEPFPMISNVAIENENPTSQDSVEINVTLDSPASVNSVNLLYEVVGNFTQDMTSISMELVSQTNIGITYKAEIPPIPSQSIVRANVEVELNDNSRVILPHEAEPIPFLSYFVYDGGIESTLPILWILPPQQSSLLNNGNRISGTARLSVGEEHPDLFDGAILIPSASNREKLRFIKGHEFDGDRTINIIPEIPTGGTNAGITSPYREHLGFWLYREMNVLSPWAKFYRIIRLDSGRHTQQLIVQQVNENFLELNGRNPDADLYKKVYTNPNWEKHTNKDEGTESLDELLSAVATRNLTNRRTEIEARLNLESFLAFSVTSMFVSNWDGYWNNNWMYLDPESQQWEIIPWDLDWIWGATPPPNEGPMYFRMPIEFPIDGVAVGNTRVSRPPGPVTSPLHQEPIFYQQYLDQLARDFHQMFTTEKLYSKMDADQQMLLDDLVLLNQQTGRNINQRNTQIQDSYETLKLYITRRRGYLEPLLPASVIDWDLYSN